MIKHLAFVAAIGVTAWTLAPAARAQATLGYVGSDYDIGGTFFPGGGPANVQSYVVVPWRSDSTAKLFDADGNNVYGSAGYAMFATRFDYPNANATGGNAFVNPTDNSVYPNLVSLPSWVSGSQILATRKAGGWGYALIDDPVLVDGFRDYNWGDSQVPPANPPSSQSPYVKLGILDGNDTQGHDPTTAAAARWSFQVGADVPSSFRLGVMTDGLDGTQFAPSQLILARVSGSTILDSASSGTVTRNRFVDMHLFDVTGAQPGDQFVVFAPNIGGASAGIAGFSFDVRVPEPGALALTAMCLTLCSAATRRLGRLVQPALAIVA